MKYVKRIITVTILVLSFINAYIDHTSLGIQLASSDTQASLFHFSQAVEIERNSQTLLNLGICKMRLTRLKEAEEHLIEARNIAPRDHIQNIDEHLDILESHLAYQRGENPQGVSYRRRSTVKERISPSRHFLRHYRSVPHSPPIPVIDHSEIGKSFPCLSSSSLVPCTVKHGIVNGTKY